MGVSSYYRRARGRMWCSEKEQLEDDARCEVCDGKCLKCACKRAIAESNAIQVQGATSQEL